MGNSTRQRAFLPTRSTVLVAVALGALAGVATGALAGSAQDRPPVPSVDPAGPEVTHLPPLLTVAGEQVELRYDVYCPSRIGDDVDDPCDAAGSVFARVGDAGPYRELALEEDPDAVEGRYVAVVPDELSRSPAGFTYYAVFRDLATGAATTLPAGGAEAPQRSLLLTSPPLELGVHRFGHTRPADTRVVSATWGSGPGQVGLEQGRNLPPIGGASFDVARDGTVFVLDEANRRLLRWRAAERPAEEVALPVNGTLADLAVAPDGSLYVLETTSPAGRPPVLRSFGADGTPRGAIAVAERGAQVRLGPDGPVVLQQPSGQWMPAARGARILAPAEQRRAGRPGRPLPGGGELVVLRREDEIRVAIVTAAGVRRSWRLVSRTPVAEVQLAEPLGQLVVLVFRTYTDREDEFVVLVLDRSGIAERFSVTSDGWAETAPLSRFRLAGGSLHRLGSTPEGLFVDRFDLEVR